MATPERMTPERMTAEQYRTHADKAPKRHKYGAKRTQFNGVWFDSALEANRYAVLLMQERAGLIKNIILQPRYKLCCGGTPILIKSAGYPKGRHSTAVLDFEYIEVATGEKVLEDAKGRDTAKSRLKRAILEAEYGLTVRIIK